MRHYLSIGAIYKNEAPYLREWVEFHRLVGVEHFYLYDNMSTDGHRAVLAPYVDEGLVEVRRWEPFPGQLQAYDDCLERHRGDSRWIAFIDCDEFLFSPLGRPVPELLGEYEDFPAVGANWCTFGDSGHVTMPAGLVIENYVMRSDDRTRNWAVKSIVAPSRTLRCGGNPHYFDYVDGARIVNENMEPMERPDTNDPPSFERLRLNHYVTKSQEERRRKLERPVAFDGRMKNVEGVMRRDRELNQIRDETILIYLPSLKEALAIGLDAPRDPGALEPLG
jgi:hypothetical protein